MAREHTPHQRKLIRNFYRNRDAIDAQRLQEVVTEIYLATTPAKQTRLWEQAAQILGRAEGVVAAEVTRIVSSRDLEALARIAGSRS